MHEYVDSMKTALRILTTIVENRCPEPADVGELRRQSSLPADALAWDVIRQALKKRDAENGGR
jgi:hypothetical protein